MLLLREVVVRVFWANQPRGTDWRLPSCFARGLADTSLNDRGHSVVSSLQLRCKQRKTRCARGRVESELQNVVGYSDLEVPAHNLETAPRASLYTVVVRTRHGVTPSGGRLGSRLCGKIEQPKPRHNRWWAWHFASRKKNMGRKVLVYATSDCLRLRSAV